MPIYPVDADVIEEVLSLFGTITNASKKLGIESIPYHHLRVALRGAPVDSAYADQIVDRWRRWKQHHLGLYSQSQELKWDLPDDFDLDERLQAEAEFWVERIRRSDQVQRRSACRVCDQDLPGHA